MNPIFEKYKLRRFIIVNGTTYTFTAPKKNRFGEPDGTSKTVKVQGVYHETDRSSGYVLVSATEGSNIKTKPESLIVCLWDDSHELEDGMEVSVGGSTYKVTNLNDVNHFGVACEISLELVLK